MGITEKMWDTITTVIKMNDRVERLAGKEDCHGIQSQFT